MSVTAKPTTRVACIWFAKPVETAKLAEYFLRFSPQICIGGDRAIFVEIGKCQSLYTEHGFLMKAQKTLQRLQLSARIVIGQDITDSLALSKYGKPGGRPGTLAHENSRVDELPLAALMDFIDPLGRDEVLRKSVQNMIDSFRNLGIRNIGQFKRLPTAELISRFGVLGRFARNRVHLDDVVPWPRWHPEEVILERKEFAFFEFYGELDPILFELKSQLDQIFARLFSRKKRLMRLQVEIACEKVSTHPNPVRTLDFEFFAPQSSTKGTLKILQERLAREFEKRPILSPIESLQTKVIKTGPFEGGQENIFNNDEEKFEQIHSLHNQLIELLGKENVYEAVLTEDRRPERSWVKKLDRPHEVPAERFDFAEIIPERPTYLLRRPVPIQVTPGFVHIAKRRYKILHWDDNVEKISGAWFEDPAEKIRNSYERSYFHVEIEGHRRLFVFETGEREFLLHGYYG